MSIILTSDIAGVPDSGANTMKARAHFFDRDAENEAQTINVHSIGDRNKTHRQQSNMQSGNGRRLTGIDPQSLIAHYQEYVAVI
jgi:hypothetical protein